MILIAGFGVLSLSEFEINGTMGSLTAIGIAIALIVDFLLLPPLLIKLDQRRDSAPDSEEEVIYAIDLTKPYCCSLLIQPGPAGLAGRCR